MAESPPSTEPLCRLDAGRPEVVLTFDDGPSPHTAALAAVLRQERVPAVFFWRGGSGRPGLDLAPALRRDGHQLGSHSVTHRRLTALGEADVRWEIEHQARVIAARGGGPVRHFRPPYGEYDARTLRCARYAGMTVVLWDLDTLDWARADAPGEIVAAAAQARPGAIVLLHERPQTVAVLPAFIARVRAAGLGFRSLPPPPPWPRRA